MRLHAPVGDGSRDDIFAEVIVLVFEAAREDRAVEKVNTHRSLVIIAARGQAEFGQQRAGNAQAVEHGRVGRFLVEASDATRFIGLHDAESRRVLPVDGQGCDGQVGSGGEVAFHQFAEIHLVKLVTAENEVIVPRFLKEIVQVLPHRIGRALVPAGAGRGLLRGEDFDEAARAEDVELVGAVDVLVERGGIELGEYVDAADARVEAIADRDVDQTVFAAEGNGRLGTIFG